MLNRGLDGTIASDCACGRCRSGGRPDINRWGDDHGRQYQRQWRGLTATGDRRSFAGETIVVPAGTYTLSSEELSIEKGLTISGHGSSDTILRSGGAFRVFEVSGGEAVTISGITIRDGEEVESNARGGGLRNSGNNLTLREVVVTHNLAKAESGTAFGGGLVNSGSLTLIDSSVTENIANASGGSASWGASPRVAASPTIRMRN